MGSPADLFHRLASEVISGGNLDIIPDLVTDDYVDHTGGDGGPQGYRETVEFVRNIFPDIKMTVEDTIEQGDKVAARFTITATHDNEFMGFAPTGRKLSWAGVGIVRVIDGKMAERWNVSDLLAAIEQIQGLTDDDPAG